MGLVNYLIIVPALLFISNEILHLDSFNNKIKVLHENIRTH
jgi:hypothetical protein